MHAHRTVLLVLAVAILTATAWIIVRADFPVGFPPIITADPNQAVSPGFFAGVASVIGGGEVTVSAYIDGEELEGSPDEMMEGQYNEFGFPIPPGCKGKVLRIVARTPDGRQSEQIYLIR